jgi:hypothetical protein
VFHFVVAVTLQGEADDDLGQLAVDLGVQAACRLLGSAPERRKPVERIVHNLARTGSAADLVRGGSDEMIESLRVLGSGTAFRNAGGRQ